MFCAELFSVRYSTVIRDDYELFRRNSLIFLSLFFSRLSFIHPNFLVL